VDISVDSGAKGKIMIQKYIAMTALALMPAVSAMAQAVPAADISTEAFVTLCQDTSDEAAQTFCFGFGEGIYQGNLVSRDPKAAPTICIPKEGMGVTRSEVLAEFVRWSRANPQYNKDYAAATVLKFLPIRFPCKG
jgi:hypothetical protein